MRLTFAGCGSAFTVGDDNYQSNVVLTATRAGVADGARPPRLLIDCGSDARFSLPRIGVKQASDIDAVYVTHTHADHIGGLEWMALVCRFGPVRCRPRLIVPADLEGPLWERSLSGGLMFTEEGAATLAAYFDVTPVADGQTFTWEGAEIQTVPAVHVDGGTIRMMSYGLFIRAAGARVYFSADVKFDPLLAERWYTTGADVIFHDCETGGRSGVHSHYDDLRTLPAELRRKMWLYHYSPGPLPDAVADGFRGFVRRGQSFELADLGQQT